MIRDATANSSDSVVHGHRRVRLYEALFLAALFVGALVFRLAVAGSPLNELTVGSLWSYDYNPALSVATGYGFVQNSPPNLRQLTPASDPVALDDLAKRFEPLRLPEPTYVPTFRVPGYSVLTIAAMWLTRTTSVAPLIHLQIVLDALVPVFVYLILCQFVSRGFAAIGAIMSALWFPEAVTASVYYATAPIPFLLLLSLWIYLWAVAHGATWRFAAFGGVWLVILYLRSELVFVPLLLCAYLFLLPVQGVRRWRRAVIPVLIIVVGLTAWVLRNKAIVGHASLTSQVGAALWEGMGYDSGLFPEYRGLYNDEAIRGLLAVYGIPLRPQPGHFFDGPQGMDANDALTSLFWRQVVLRHPADLAWHLLFKLRENYLNLRNWHGAIVEFGYQRHARLSIGAGWLDALMLLVPFLCLVVFPWRTPGARLAGVFLVCLLGLHVGLLLTVSGPLRYTVTLSPCYPILIAVLGWNLTGRAVLMPAAAGLDRLRAVPLLLAGLAALTLVGLSRGWPSVPAAAATLDLQVMPIASTAGVRTSPNIALSPTGTVKPESNFALGRRVEFMPAPTYPGISGPGDATDLTDGAIDETGTFTLRGWVGWGMNAPIVFAVVPLGTPRFVTSVRVHTIQQDRWFPLSRVRVWESQGGERTLVASVEPATTKTRTAWISVPVNGTLVKPMIELQPTNVSDRYVFVDEIQVLGAEAYEATGEIVFGEVHLVCSTPGDPVAAGEIPRGTEARLSFRHAPGGEWQSAGWDKTFFQGRVQFKLVLYASPDQQQTPLVSRIEFVPR